MKYLWDKGEYSGDRFGVHNIPVIYDNGEERIILMHDDTMRIKKGKETLMEKYKIPKKELDKWQEAIRNEADREAAEDAAGEDL